MIKDTRQNPSPNRVYDVEIKKHYDRVADTDKDAASSTMADLHVRETETKFIEQQIKDFTRQQKNQDLIGKGPATGSDEAKKFSILDVGCGNGYTLENLSNAFPDFHFQGIEFNDALREIANQRFAKKNNVSINKGDIRNIDSLPEEKVDILICQRVLINLLDENDQKSALDNLIKVVKPNGLLIFIECFKSGLDHLNSARQEFDLEALSPAHHNLYLSDAFFDHTLLLELDHSQAESFSTHYFVSRVLHQAFLNATQKELIRNSHFVSFFSKALPPDVGRYSPLKMLSFLKQK